MSCIPHVNWSRIRRRTTWMRPWLGKGLFTQSKSRSKGENTINIKENFAFASELIRCKWGLKEWFGDTPKNTCGYFWSHCIVFALHHQHHSPTPHYILCLQMTSLLIPCYQGKGNNYMRDSQVEFQPSPTISAGIRHNLSQRRWFCGPGVSSSEKSQISKTPLQWSFSQIWLGFD